MTAPYGSFVYGYTNQLNKKQEQTMATVEKICLSFSDKSKKNVVWRTWGEIRNLSGLSSGVLTKYLSKQLIPQELSKWKAN